MAASVVTSEKFETSQLKFLATFFQINRFMLPLFLLETAAVVGEKFLSTIVVLRPRGVGRSQRWD